MSDMLAAIEPKSDQINAEDLIGGDRVVTVTAVQVRPGTEQPVSMSIAGTDKVFRPCKTVSRIIVKAWGPDSSQYVGRSLHLYRDPDVTWGGMKVGGIRVRAMSHIDGPLSLALAESKKARKITTVQPLKLERAPEPLTIEQAQLDIEAAADMEALRVVWQRKDMKPHREVLASLLERRKAILSDVDDEA